MLGTQRVLKEPPSLLPCQHQGLPGHWWFLALGLCIFEGGCTAQLLAGSEVWVRVLGREGGCRALIGLGEAGRGGVGFEQ